MIAFRIRELMELRGLEEGHLRAALGWDRETLIGVLDGRIGVTCEKLVDIAQWLDVPLWALMPGPAVRIERSGEFYGADTLEGAADLAGGD